MKTRGYDIHFDRFMSVLAGNLYHRNVMAKIDCPLCAVENPVIPYVPPVDPWYVRFIKWCSGYSHAASASSRRP